MVSPPLPPPHIATAIRRRGNGSRTRSRSLRYHQYHPSLYRHFLRQMKCFVQLIILPGLAAILVVLQYESLRQVERMATATAEGPIAGVSNGDHRNSTTRKFGSSMRLFQSFFWKEEGEQWNGHNKNYYHLEAASYLRQSFQKLQEQQQQQQQQQHHGTGQQQQQNEEQRLRANNNNTNNERQNEAFSNTTTTRTLEKQQQHHHNNRSSVTTTTTARHRHPHNHHSISHERHYRRRPHDKVIHFVHIHKSGGTVICEMAQANHLSVEEHQNCNVQTNQRCCSVMEDHESTTVTFTTTTDTSTTTISKKNHSNHHLHSYSYNPNTIETQREYARQTPYDLVASEAQLYDGLDYESYHYIVVLRHSQDRYWSHYQHVVREHPLRVLAEQGGGTGAGASDDHNNNNNNVHQNDTVGEVRRRRKLQKQSRHMTKTTTTTPPPSKTLAPVAATIKPPAAAMPYHVVHADGKTTTNVQDHPDPNNIIMTNTAAEAETTTAGRRRRQLQSEKENYDSPAKREQQLQHDHAHHHSNVRPSSRRRLLEQPPPQQKNEMTAKPFSYSASGIHHRRGDVKHRVIGVKRIPHPCETNKNRLATMYGIQQDDPRGGGGGMVVGRNFSDWWRRQPDNWNVRQLCGTHCMGIPKYQLTDHHWNYTLDRFLQFQTVLFLEDLQHSVTVLAERLQWNESNITRGIQRVQEWRDANNDNASDNGAGGADADDRVHHHHSKKKTTTSSRALFPYLHHLRGKGEGQQNDPNTTTTIDEALEKEEQMSDWDPLMTALDDALYDIGQRWEDTKLQQQQQAGGGRIDSESSKDTENLPTAIRQNLERYFQDEPDNHRHQCTTECCASPCSAW